MMVRSMEDLSCIDDKLCKLQDDMLIHALQVPHSTARGRQCTAQFRTEEYNFVHDEFHAAAGPASKKKAKRKLRREDEKDVGGEENECAQKPRLQLYSFDNSRQVAT